MQNMDEHHPQVIPPVVEKDGNWQARQHAQKASPASGEEQQEECHENERRPAPLPFGKIDVIA